jgi:hypothetical protein
MHPVNEGRYHPILRGLRRNAGVHVKTELLRGREEASRLAHNQEIEGSSPSHRK